MEICLSNKARLFCQNYVQKGIDIMLMQRPFGFDPIVIEVNSHDCMINCQIYEFMNTETKGDAAMELINTMISRSQHFLVEFKKILIIGSGSFGKQFTLKDTEAYGMKVILVDTKPPQNLSQEVTFIAHDLTDLTQTFKIASEIIKKIETRKLCVDGCLTFWEDHVPLTAKICEKLQLTSSSCRSCSIAKNKYLTHKFLQRRSGDIPHWPRTLLYSSNVHQINKREDIARILKRPEVSLPVVLKLVYGSSAIGVKLVETESECSQYFDQVKETLDNPTVGLGLGCSLILMDYLLGTEHDVDVIMYGNKLIGAFVSDNGPTRMPYFTETAALLPTILSDEKKNQLITAAFQCCLEIGLESGVFNVELIMTTKGPKLCEINARMGGIYLRDWIKECYGVDLLFCSLLISLGIRPYIKPLKPSVFLAGIMCLASEHMNTLQDSHKMALLKAKHESGLIRYNQFLEKPILEEYEEPFSNIAVIETDPFSAKKSLIKLSREFQINTPNYNVESFLGFISNSASY